MNGMRRFLTIAAASTAALGVLVAPAMAQRDPAYAAARANGSIGEQPNGYLGIVGNATPALQRLVNDINIKRKAVYTREAQENNATVEAYAMTSGCLAISRTVPGEKYMDPNGTWRTRTREAPVRDPRCP